MDNTRICPMDNQIFKIITSSGPKGSILQALNILEKIVSGLLSPNFQNRYKILQKEDPLLSKQLFNIEATHEFLLFIGYHEEKGNYLHGACDETMKILEDACKLLSCRISQYKDNDDQENPDIQEKENLGNDNLLDDQKPKKKECKITNFLMKHFRKEQVDAAIPAKYQSKKPFCSNFAFNSGGYFHQSANSDDSIRKKDPKKDIFEEHERGLKNKRFCILSMLKRK